MPSKLIHAIREQDFLLLVHFNQQNAKPEVQFLGDNQYSEYLAWEINCVNDGSKLVSFHGIDARDTEMLDYMSEVVGEAKNYVDVASFTSPETIHTIFYDKKSALSRLACELLIWTLVRRYQTKELPAKVSWVLFGIIAGYELSDIRSWINAHDTPTYTEAWQQIYRFLPASLIP